MSNERKSKAEVAKIEKTNPDETSKHWTPEQYTVDPHWAAHETAMWSRELTNSARTNKHGCNDQKRPSPLKCLMAELEINRMSISEHKRMLIKMAYVHGTGPPRHSRDSISNIVTRTVSTNVNNTMHTIHFGRLNHAYSSSARSWCRTLSEVWMTPETTQFSAPDWYHCHYLNRNNCRM